jgi:hypothetical protein
VIDVTELKRSSKLLIYDSRHYLYCVYRAPGDWSNPNTFSLIGTEATRSTACCGRSARNSSWRRKPATGQVIGKVENPADSEINTIWTFGRPIDSLVFVPAAYGGLLCLKPSALWLFGKMLSPAALSVMRAMPHLFEDR